MEDVKFIRGESESKQGMIKVLTTWMTVHSFAMAFTFGMDYLNLNLELYNTQWYYPLSNTV